MTQIEIILATLLLIAVFYALIQRKARRKQTESYNRISERCSELFRQRNTLARMYLLYVIPKEKITDEKKHKNDGIGLNFICSFHLEGLVASNLSPEELSIMDKVDQLLDGRIFRDGDRFEIPK